MAKSVPDRWLEYKAFGKVIKGTKIVAFKVPLKETLVKDLPPDQRFTTATLLKTFPRLKHIVDLTNTFRYYDQKEFTAAGLRYDKIMVPGALIPRMDVIKKFFKSMDDFSSTSGDDDLVGVHCTHGVNRTGYLICRYLVQQLGWECQDSIKAFEEARGHTFDREIFVNDLKKVPKGEKIDTSKVTRSQPVPMRKMLLKDHTLKRFGRHHLMGPPGPPGFVPPPGRRGFAANGAPYPQPFGFRPPGGFGPMGPPPGPMPPPPPGPMFGPPRALRPSRPPPPRFGLPPHPMRPPLPPPGPGGMPPRPGFHPMRMPVPPRMPPGPPRLPPCPPPRIPGPQMPPPPPPVVAKRLQTPKKKVRRDVPTAPGPRSSALHQVSRLRPRNLGGPKPPAKEQDFTVDTFEENLASTRPTPGPVRRPKTRFGLPK
ncbi:uncharacterized protein LOC105700088 [Orussus abietinus]|uniref:uncharacterized protein LOC105700088 n=1 Tax=Orussus abietinus TaxID=222816 RepID=UPI000625F246|nr:uncharacterized protein LOC105700088 [Orussus abietinus]